MGEPVERIYNLALENIKLFQSIIIFENYNTDLKVFFKKFKIDNFSKNFYDNKIPKKNLDKNEIEAIRAYNYWDLKLYANIINFLKKN